MSSGANDLLVLSCDVIIWDDNTPLFIFPENFTHSILKRFPVLHCYKTSLHLTSPEPESAFVNAYGAQKSIPAYVAWRARRQIGLSYRSTRMGIDS